MHLVSVTPIQRGVLRGELSFFSKTPILRGAVVRAPVRGRLTPSLVLSSTDVREVKLDLKSAGFALKKIDTKEPKRLLSDELMTAVERAGAYALTTPGVVLSHLVPAAILGAPHTLRESKSSAERSGVESEVLTLQAERSERFHTYRSMVRESFARGASIMVIAPSLVEVERLKLELERGITDQLSVVSSAVSLKELKRTWNRVAEEARPHVIVGTPLALSFPLGGVDTIVIERESARAYVSRTHPRIDFRIVAEYYAAALGARLILADFPLRVETYARRDLGTGDELARPQARSLAMARVSVVDTRATDEKRESRRVFSPLEPHTHERIHETLSYGGTVAVYAARKGIAPLTVCNDCGTPIMDESTGVPMVLHKTPRGNVFVSHRSGAILPAERSCATCGGWNLVSLGIGVDRVVDALRKKHADATIVPFTADSVTSHRAAEKAIRALYDAPRGIIVGTERMLPYLDTVHLSIVASIDSVLSLASWRAGREAEHTLYTLLERTQEELIIETRQPTARPIVSIAIKSPIESLREEVRERKQYDYPPFSTFIGFSWSGSEPEVSALAREVTDAFHDLDLVGPLPPETEERGRLRQRAALRLPTGLWPDPELRARILALNPRITSTVDPDDIV